MIGSPPLALFRSAAIVLTTLLASCATDRTLAEQATAANTIKHEVAEMVAGINVHDVDRATQFDAPDIVSMESMRAPSVGAAADREGLSMAFKYAPSWHLQMIDENVEVASAGDIAIYRSTYDENSIEHDVPMTHRDNFIAEFKRQSDDSWKIVWSVVCAQQHSHAR
jgi:ketosteroid isomerase-like protein